MDIVVMFNGLGNQMSQYALYLSKRSAGQSVAFLPISNAHNGFELDRLFGIARPTRLWTSAFRLAYHFFGSRKLPLLALRKRLAGLLQVDRFDEDLDYRYHAKVAETAISARFLVGGWHTDRYFAGVSSEVRRVFRFPEINDAKNLSALAAIRSNVSVSIHARRGDYNNSVHQSSFGSVCPPDFYQRALGVMREKIPDFKLVVFSNDPTWARENIHAPDVLYVDWNHKNSSWIDMYLMSQCNHNIICNSTFSWWGAWLNEHRGRVVVCPDRFVADEVDSEVYPADWIRVDTRGGATQ